MKKHTTKNLLIALALCVVYSCVEYHPYDTNIDGEKGLNERNIALIEELCRDCSEIRFAVVSDSQRWYDELKLSIESINAREDIDFVIHAGDIADFGLRTEFEVQRDMLQKLDVPFVCLLGNHDCLGTGEIIFRKMFGDFNFSFTAAKTRFVCLNTNALEFDANDAVPDIGFIEEELQSLPSDIERSVVVMHAYPYCDQFNNEVAEEFHSLVRRFPSIEFCLHGHGHTFRAKDIFEDDIIYYQCPSSGERAYMIFTINEEGYSYEKIDF